jgi:hypothetical protein
MRQLAAGQQICDKLAACDPMRSFHCEAAENPVPVSQEALTF